MNAGLDHIEHVAARLGTLATALTTKIARPDEHAAMLKGAGHALASPVRSARLVTTATNSFGLTGFGT